MTKHAAELAPNYAPVYAAALYPELANLFQTHGYALAVHGSLARDFDLIAVPWVEAPSTHEAVIEEMCSRFAIQQIGKPAERPPGRLAYFLSIGFGECAIDLSFFPDQVQAAAEHGETTHDPD